jgi:hypothetical protein
MKRTILLIFTFIILGGVLLFYYLNKRIEGVWISHYSKDLNGEKTYCNGKDLIEIKNQKFFYHSHNYNGVTPQKIYFESGLRIIYRNRAWEKISSVNKDSLVIISGYDDDKIFNTTMKRVPDSLQNDSDWNKKLLGKTFKFHIQEYNYTDTIFFDDNYVRSKNRNLVKEWDVTQSWKLAKIDGFDILFGSNWPTFILKEEENVIKFYGFDRKKFFTTELIEIIMDSSDVKKLIEIKKKEK